MDYFPFFRKHVWEAAIALEEYTRRRTVSSKPKELHDALQQSRRREKSREFQEEYSNRAGIEGTISQEVRAFWIEEIALYWNS